MSGSLDLHFDIAALIIIAVLLLMITTKKSVPIKRSFIFLVMIDIQVLVILCSIGLQKSMFGSANGPGILGTLCADLFFALDYLDAILFMYYMVLWSGSSIKKNIRAKILFYIPLLLYAFIIGDNFLRHNLYTLDAKMGLVGTGRLVLLSLVAMYSMLFGIIYAIRYVNAISFARLTVITVAATGVMVAVFLQYRYPDVLFVNFVMAICQLILYEVAQNSSNILDGNTQLLNRDMMDELLSIEIAEQKNFDLLVLAMDDFKLVNKTYGIDIGDIMLRQVADFLNTVNKRAKVFRYGSDQFAVQIRHKYGNSKDLLEVITERFRHPWIYENVSVILSTTTICISYPDDGENLDGLIEVLDYSIQYAKQYERGAIIHTSDIDLHAMRKEKAIEKALEEALRQDTIEVHYQPIYNTKQNCYTSAEALVRFRDERLGNISPEIFIPLAEKTGNIVKLGNMVFEKVCKMIHDERLSETTIEYVEVNVSVIQCMQSDFVETILSIMEKYDVKPEQINLEITETAEINSISVLKENVERLHEKGISFSLDDYGSGYSTLGYIHQFPFSIIKLDKLMVWDGFENDRGRITLKHTVGMIKDLNLHIVAEGVETEQQQKRLAEMGVDYLQGWYYSKAVPKEEFISLIWEVAPVDNDLVSG